MKKASNKSRKSVSNAPLVSPMSRNALGHLTAGHSSQGGLGMGLGMTSTKGSMMQMLGKAQLEQINSNDKPKKKK